MKKYPGWKDNINKDNINPDHYKDGEIECIDAMDGIGVPAEWMNSREDVEELVDAAAEAEEEQLQLEQMVQGSEVAKNIGQAGQDLEMV